MFLVDICKTTRRAPGYSSVIGRLGGSDCVLGANWAGGQYRAMRHGIDGILGNLGNVESASCTFQM